MNQEDRYHTTSWDGNQVRRQAEGAARSGQSAPKKMKKKRPVRRGMNPLLGLLLWVITVAASSFILAGVGWMLANDLCALNKPYQEVILEITEDFRGEVKTVEEEDGTTSEVSTMDMKKVAALLEEEGLIEYGWFFRLFSLVISGDEKVGVGTFELNTDMDYRALIYGMIPTGKVGGTETVDVTIPEGYTVAQIFALLEEKGVNTVEELTQAAEEHIFEGYGFIDNENLGSITRLEGYLYPDTYNFYMDGNPAVALDAMLKNFNNKVYGDAEMSSILEELEGTDYDFGDIITIASLIEKETDGTDRDKISSVIYNRLENVGETYHMLQIDAALVYAAGRPITQEDYETLDSPYNLYQHEGLPPTPICNPGQASIIAAIQPADTNYYFYVLGPDNLHIFSETLAEHEAAKAGAGQ